MSFLTTKQIGIKIKAAGLQKLRFYCQMCNKQCRDANGFKCHLTTETHLTNMTSFSAAPSKILAQNTSAFLSDFLSLLRARYVDKRVSANRVYQEFISDRNHLHMNATTFSCLSALVQHLGRNNICEIEETDKGWFIIYRHKEVRIKTDTLEKSQTEWEEKMLENAIERAGPRQEQEIERVLVRESEDKIKMELKSTKLKKESGEPKKKRIKL